MSEKRITITADGSGFSRETQRTANTAARAFSQVGEAAGKVGEKASSGMTSFREMMEGIQGDAKEIFEEMLAESENLNSSVRERAGMMREELRQLEQATKLEQERARLRAGHDLGQARSGYASGEISLDKLSDAEDSYRDAIKDANLDRQTDQFRNRMIGEHISEFERRNNDELEDEEEERRRRDNNVGAIAANQGRGAIGATAGAVGLGALASLSIGAIMGEMLRQGEDLEVSRRRFGVTIGGGRLGTDGAEFGMREADYRDYARSAAASRGGFLDGKSIRQQLAVEKGFGLDPGFLNALGGKLREGNMGEGETTSNAVLTMLQIFRNTDIWGIDKDDFSALGEKIGILTNLMDVGRQQSERTDNVVVTSLMAALNTLGGSFADDRSQEVITKLNSSIANPNSEFSKAFVFRSLRQANPEMDLFELLGKSQEGVFGEGNLSAVLGNLKKASGGDDKTMALNIRAMTGLNLDQSMKLAQGSGSEDFTKLLGELGLPGGERIQNLGASNEAALSRARGTVGPLQSVRARVENQAGETGVGLIKALDPLMEMGLNLFEGVTEVLTDIFEGVPAFLEAGNRFFQKAENFFGSDKVEGGFRTGKKKSDDGRKDQGSIEVLRDIRNILRTGSGTNSPTSIDALKGAYWQNENYG